MMGWWLIAYIFDNTGGRAGYAGLLSGGGARRGWGEHPMWNRTCQLGVMENLFVQIYQCGQAGVEVSLASERVTGVRVTQVQPSQAVSSVCLYGGVYSPMRYNISTCCAVLAWPTTRGDSSRRAAAQTSHRQAVHVVVYQPRGPAYVPVPRHVEREPTRRPRARQAPASVYMRRKRTPPQCWERETGRPLCPSAVRLRPQSVSVPAEKENGKATKRSSPRAKRQIPNSTARHPKGKIARNSDSETGSVQRQEGSSLQMGPAASCVRV